MITTTSSSSSSLPLSVAGTVRPRSGILQRVPTVERVLLGLLFAVFGLNGFLDFIPPPAEPQPEGAMAFAVALMKTGYMFPLIKAPSCSPVCSFSPTASSRSRSSSSRRSS